ncbi:MAG: hypothetical protein LDL31_10935, partial [Prosthecobacter sp.]|nr:hypothetical protein [Prosthecobacter sp.]
LFERLDESLHWQADASPLRVDVSFLQDTEIYAAESHPLGLLNTDDSAFLQPRLSAFFDLQSGDSILLHAQARLDRGFDPGFAPDGQVRLDEYYLRWKPTGDERLRIQVGKFATVIGAWPRRNLSWDNPLITAPGPYESMLAVSDDGGPASLGAFLDRRNAPSNPQTWLPLIWGPAYITGASVSGQLDAFDYAFEIRTAAPSARPGQWDAIQSGFHSPHYAGRLGWRPSPEWTLGASAAHGPYLRPESQALLGSSHDWQDFQQTTLGIDAGYAHGHWQFWAELLGASFDVPKVGRVRVLSGYLESRYKIGAQTWLSARWNQSHFGDAPSTDISWDRDAWRLDLGIGHRFSRHLQGKLQYSLAGRSGGDHPEGQHLFAAQFSVRF